MSEALWVFFVLFLPSVDEGGGGGGGFHLLRSITSQVQKLKHQICLLLGAQREVMTSYDVVLLGHD